MSVSLLAGLGVRVHSALTDAGIYWPDEIYQSIEPAHRLVFGYGMVAWEFIDGARNWALPGLLAGLLQLSKGLGGDTPFVYLPVVKTFFAVLSACTALGIYRLARTYEATPLAASVGAATFSLSAVTMYFGPRAMSEVVCALPAVFGLALTLQREARARTLVLGASLLGLAVLARLQMGIFCIGALGILLGRRHFSNARLVFGILLVWAFLFGLLDALTWGHWFHSARQYLQFNLVEGKSSMFGTDTADYYARYAFSSMGVLALVMAWASLWASRKALGLFLIAVSFFLLHTIIPHKELRFLYPVLPVFSALAAIGASRLPKNWNRLLLGALLLTTCVSALNFPKLTFGDLGAYVRERPHSSAHHDVEGVNQLLMAASQNHDVCGVRIDVVHLAWTGGLSYLHRPARLYHLGQPPLETQYFNYLITWSHIATPGEVVAFDAKHAFKLVRLFPHCRVDEAYSWRLP